MIVDIASGERADDAPAKDEAAVSLGRKGGKARAAAMTPERRVEIAKKAAERRWKKAVDK
jgi:general stress protein YciG